MPFPHQIQSALLFETPVDILDAALRNFIHIETARTGVGYHIMESKPGVFYRLAGPGGLMITLEYVAGPAKPEIFRPAMSSAVTRLYCSDIPERLLRHKSHILVGVMNGARLSSPGIDQFLSEIGYQDPGETSAQWLRRIEICATLARVLMDEAGASAVHWTQSDQLLSGDMFETLASGASANVPGPLHVHPFLYGGGENAAGKALAGIQTYGAAHFVGREIRIAPTELPWMASYAAILRFLKVATMAGGYVIPDNDIFGPDDHSEAYRVRHIEAREEDAAFYEIEPLMHREYAFQAADYVPRERVFDDRTLPDELMPSSPDERQKLAEEWRQKRGMAEGIGGQFEVRARAPRSGPDAPQLQRFDVRRSFGRKR
ncbi:hypothetical protein [Sphingopyxis sp. MWB1]|uniref:hypothetical protein n=1 Tax=Sphingopyxis sp. MWB1 TaxID=1537715 RepID=UPI00051A19B0|nr:hypothetical protein [Sphingopyxis sp. MWB1]